MASKGYLITLFCEYVHPPGKIGTWCIMDENSFGISKLLSNQRFALGTKCVASNGDNSKRISFEAFGRKDLSKHEGSECDYGIVQVRFGDVDVANLPRRW